MQEYADELDEVGVLLNESECPKVEEELRETKHRLLTNEAILSATQAALADSERRAEQAVSQALPDRLTGLCQS